MHLTCRIAFYMSRTAVPAAVLLAGIAAWLSQGTLALATAGGPRLAVLPVSIAALLTVAAVMVAVVGFARAGVVLTPIWLLLLVVLPWLPLPASAALLAWSGPIRSLVWCAVTLLLGAQLVPRIVRVVGTSTVGDLLRSRPRLAAGAIAFVIFLSSAWQVSSLIPGGDEPHYLVITQSLLLDGDLKIENNHRRGDYQAYYAGALPPHYIQRGRNGEIYSIHAPGLSAIVAPAFAIGGYRAVVIFLIVMAACGSALAWHLGWLASGSTSAAWFGWAATTLSATAIFHSFTVYPDGLGGVVALTGVWALFRARQERTTGDARLLPWFLHGAALALLPWMHSRFALLAGSLGALVLVQLPATKKPAEKAVAFLSVPAVSAMAWLAFFVAIYGRPDPSAPYGPSSRDFSVSFIPGGLAGLLFDERFGLVANAPVLAFGFAGLVWMLWKGPKTNATAPDGLADRRLSLELLFVLVPYLLTATSYAMWWAGWSAPARFANPAVFAMAIPAAVLWRRAIDGGHRATATVAAGSLAMTAFISFVLVNVSHGRLAYNTRDTTALLLDWASPLVALGEGMPAWYRGRELPFTRDVAVWLIALTIGYVVARSIGAWPALRDRIRYATVLTAVFAAAGMIALTIVWWLHGTNGVVPAPAQLAVLRRLATEPRLLAMQLEPPRILDRAEMLAGLHIASDTAPSRAGQGRGDQPLVTLPSLPAGHYRIRPRVRGQGGWLMLGVAPDQFSLWSAPMPAGSAPIEIDLPVDVRALIVRGDEETRRAMSAVIVEPVSLVAADARVTDLVARRAVKYGDAIVFFLDEGCFPEPEAFWLGGARQGTFVVQSATARTSVPIQLRNAPVENTVTLVSGQWRESLTLAPGEERRIEIPLLSGRTSALVTASSTSGFRPSEHDRASRDDRFLGAWMKVGIP